MTLRVHVFLEIFYWLALTFAKAPGPFGEQRGMAMARASLVRSLLVWLQVLQQLYRMMAPAGVIIPAPTGGTPGRHTHACLLSPSGRLT